MADRPEDTRRAGPPASRTVRAVRATGIVVAALGAAALVGWATGWLRLAALASERIPMAPSTALLFVVHSLLLLFAARPGDPRRRRPRIAGAAAATALALALLIAASIGRGFEVEHAGFDHASSPDGFPMGHMSPLTAALFLATGIAQLLLLSAESGRRARAAASGLAAGLVVFSGGVLSIAYLLGAPLLYGGGLIPPALSTSFAFVALGVGLLLLAIRSSHAGHRARPAAETRTATPFAWILALFAGCVVAGGYAYFSTYQQRFRSNIEESLEAIAELKVRELELWRAERLGDARLFGDNRAFSTLLARLLASPGDPEAGAALASWLDSVRAGYGYLRVELLDSRGRALLASGGLPAAPQPHLAGDVDRALRSREVSFLDFHRDTPDGPPRLALVAPVYDGGAADGRALGAIVLVIDPAQSIDPMLRRWPTPSQTAETALVRRDGTDALVLNELRFRQDTALRLRLPLSEPLLPEAMAARGIEGPVEGIGLRGQRVIAALRAVPGSTWRLVARVDAAEALAPARERLWTVVALLAALLAGALAALIAVWQRNAKAHYRAVVGAREALAASEATLRKIFEGVADGIVIADAESRRIVRANPAFLDMLGYRPEDLASLSVEDLHPGPERQRALAAFERQLLGEIRIAPDLQVRRADGSHFTAAISATRVQLDGRAHLLGVFRDITERRSAETRIAHLNSVLRAIRHINQLITRESDRDRLIRSACELLVEARGFAAVAIGLTDESGERVLSRAGAGARVASLWPEVEPGLPPALAREALARGDLAIRARDGDRDDEGGAAAAVGVAGDEIALPVQMDGRSFGFLLASVATGLCDDPEERDLLREAVGDIAFALRSIEVAAARDRSRLELAEREDQLRQSQKLEAIGLLAGGVAHDFNNLLLVILGYCESLTQGLAPEDPLRADVEEIVAAGRRAAELTHRLLAFGRAQALRPERLDLNAVVAGMESMLRRLIGEDVELRTRLEARGGRVEADPGQLEQVLMNLVVNARDAMPRGGRLTIATADVEVGADFARQHPDATPGSYVLWTVADTGSGMDEATKSRIFEPFYTTKAKGTGSGLGLSVVYGIVRQSKGSIGVDSAPGQGTTFRIYLPRIAGAADERPATAPRRPAAARGAGEHLLVVEDEPALRRLLQPMLANLGYRVTIAARGDEALAAVESRDLRPDLLLTDVVMPGLSGSELAARLRARQPGLRVLFMSGYTDDALGHHGVLEPGTLLLQKPFGSAELAAKVRAALEGPTGPEREDYRRR